MQPIQETDDLVRSRQRDLVDEKIFDTPLTVIGAGGIGSFTVLTLAKMGFKFLEVWDDDAVSPENIANQFYRIHDVGDHKVVALQSLVFEFEDMDIAPTALKWSKDTLKEVVISAVDSMQVRKEIYEHARLCNDTRWLIDGRMGGQQAEVLVVDLDSAEECKAYEATLWTDEEAFNAPCTQKAVMYNVLWIASMISNVLRLALEGKEYVPHILYDFENCNQLTIRR